MKLALERDVEDCQSKLLTGYLKGNLCHYTNITRNVSEVAGEGLHNELLAAKTSKKNRSLKTRTETSSPKSQAILTRRNDNYIMSNFNTVKLKEKPGTKQTVLVKVCNNNASQVKNIESIQNRLFSTNISHSRVSRSLLRNSLVHSRSVNGDSLPRNGGCSARPNSPAGSLLSSRGNNSSFSTEKQIFITEPSQHCKDDPSIARQSFPVNEKSSIEDGQNGEIEASLSHSTVVNFEKYSKLAETKTILGRLGVSGSYRSAGFTDALVNGEDILRYLPGTKSREHVSMETKTEREKLHVLLPNHSNLLSFTTINEKQSFPRLTPRPKNSYKPVYIPVNLAKPVLLKMKHRQDKFINRGREAHEEGRLLPTTLSGLKRGGYSVMTPYMASVVWSIMEDESVDLSRDVSAT